MEKREFIKKATLLSGLAFVPISFLFGKEATKYFNGQIKDVKIFNKVLDAEAVATEILSEEIRKAVTKDEKRIYKKWKKSGFLEPFSVEEGTELAKLFENTIKITFDDQSEDGWCKKEYGSDFGTVILPIEFRIFKETKDTDHIRIINFVQKVIHPLWNNWDDDNFPGYSSGIDKEAEVCRVIAHEYCFKYHNVYFL